MGGKSERLKHSHLIDPESARRALVAVLDGRYGIKVVLVDDGSDLEIGDLAGLTIRVNAAARDPREICFVIAHLFGHMVQFTTFELYRSLVETAEKPRPLRLTADFKSRFGAYELEAFQYGKALLVQALGDKMVRSWDRAYAIYYQVDLAEFIRYLEGGPQLSALAFNAVLQESYATRLNPECLIASRAVPSHVAPARGATIY